MGNGDSGTVRAQSQVVAGPWETPRELTPRERLYVLALIDGKGIAGAAEAAGISVDTAWAWRTKRPWVWRAYVTIAQEEGQLVASDLQAGGVRPSRCFDARSATKPWR